MMSKQFYLICRWILICGIIIIFFLFTLSHKRNLCTKIKNGFYYIATKDNRFLQLNNLNPHHDGAYVKCSDQPDSIHGIWFINKFDPYGYNIHNLSSFKVMDYDIRYINTPHLPLAIFELWDGKNQFWDLIPQKQYVQFLNKFDNKFLEYFTDVIDDTIKIHSLKASQNNLFLIKSVDFNSSQYKTWTEPFKLIHNSPQSLYFKTNLNNNSCLQKVFIYRYFDTNIDYIYSRKDAARVIPSLIYQINSDESLNETNVVANNLRIVKNPFGESKSIFNNKINFECRNFSNPDQSNYFLKSNFGYKDSILTTFFQYPKVDSTNRILVILHREDHKKTLEKISHDNNALSDKLFIYASEIIYGSFALIIMTGNYSINELEYLARFNFIDNYWSGTHVGIDIDKMMQAVEYRIYYSITPEIIYQRLHLKDFIDKFSHHNHQEFHPIYCQWKNYNKNTPIWHYCSQTYLALENSYNE